MVSALNFLTYSLLNEVDETDTDKSTDKKSGYQKAAEKMVDNIEKRRKAGKYTDAERKKLIKVFVDNMDKMSKGNI